MTLRRSQKVLILLLGIVAHVFYPGLTNAENRFDQKGYQANGDPNSDKTTLLSLLGELIARERAFHEATYELNNNAKGSSLFDKSLFNTDASILSAVLGDDFYSLYDEVLPKLEALGQANRRDEIALRFKPELQQQLIAGERVANINDGAVNNVVAHYKIAIEQLDATMRQLLLAESHMIRRSADELAQAFDESANVVDYVSYVRASRLLSATRKIKGFVQPRCTIESDIRKQSRAVLNEIADGFYFDSNRKLQTSVQEIYNAAGDVEKLATSLLEDGSHC